MKPGHTRLRASGFEVLGHSLDAVPRGGVQDNTKEILTMDPYTPLLFPKHAPSPTRVFPF